MTRSEFALAALAVSAWLFAVLVVVIGLSVEAVAYLQPCPTEDSVGCTWSASEQGNGQGRSFIAVSDDLIVYLP